MLESGSRPFFQQVTRHFGVAVHIPEFGHWLCAETVVEIVEDIDEQVASSPRSC
jgi:hypothetical protein